MSSCQLTVGITAPSNKIAKDRTPIHVAFSSEGDHLAVLYSPGYVRLWNLHTRVEFSRAKAMSPSDVCEIDFRSVVDAWTSYIPRQICFWKSPGGQDVFKVACLASNSDNDTDSIVIVDINEKEVVGSSVIQLKNKNGRLVKSTRHVYWQSQEGCLFEGNNACIIVNLSTKLNYTFSL